MRPFLAALLAAIALAGCRSTLDSAAPVATTVPFDPAAAAYIKKAGAATIKGHAFWRDDNGGVVNAAGEIIRLVPATPYARQRFAALYKGGRSLPASEVPHVNPDPQYADYTRTTRAESNGRFEFDHVAPGVYFVTAQVRYRDKDSYVQIKSGVFRSRIRTGNDGGAMFDTVTVAGKEDKPIKLVLTNDR
ncbi:MAG: carboxypeptidase regulatory-like domain-containing protein [Methylobacteriaceae bacterium]|nr:carboxypeptidase regulatory-like domain-containing protein [Methylobacteriaceae bacterium]